ncbi:MAG: hypothetical protein Q9Q40_01790 [Acidobacteriota bacterium]|nr:hypothetical protein [Acidobacteriota bacterium]
MRLAGFSPRRAPDLARTEVLLRQGEDPAAAVVDLISTGEEGIAVLQALAEHTTLIAIAPETPSDLGLGAARCGAEIIGPDEVSAALPPLLSRVAKDEPGRTGTVHGEAT